MPQPSAAASIVLFATVLAVAVLFLRALRLTAAGQGAGGGMRVAITVLLGWLVIPGALARAGLLDRYDPLPAPALLVVGAITIATAVLAMSRVGKRFAAGLPLAALVGFQAFRIPVEWMLHRLYVDGVVPVQMTYAGRNFDVLTGLTAAGLAWWLASGRAAPRVVLAWNAAGFALLANIVIIAVLSTPVPFRQFTEGPANRLPGLFPFVWLPTFLVQAALFGHLVVFRAMLRSTPAVRGEH